jgi:tRNA-specific 2-thiouridylase
VIRIDQEKNAVIVGEEGEVFGDHFRVDSVNWIDGKGMDASLAAQVKIRYNHPGAEAILSPAGRNEVEVKFEAPQKAITPGQAAVFYNGEVVLGGGWIKQVIQ